MCSKRWELSNISLLCVIDTETTGLGKFDHSVKGKVDYPISLGAVIADVNILEKRVRYVDGMHSLIRIPDTSRAEDTMLIHGILPKELDDAPQPADVCTAFKGLLSRYEDMPACAWNYRFDKHFVDLLFRMGHMVTPELAWKEMMPTPYAGLERYVRSCVTQEGVLGLDAHNAFNDCIRALAVHAALHGYSLEMPGNEGSKARVPIFV
jgi:hypothetical protein